MHRKDLNERFSVVNGSRIQQLKSDIARCEQSNTMNVATYFEKLKIRFTLLSQDPLTSLNRAFQQISQEERVRGITRVKDEKARGVEPKSFKEAVKDEGWRKAMQTEIRALEDNDTWTMEKLPPGKRALGSQWVYKIKYNFDDTVERLKARLVVFGNHQVAGIDYNETFAPVTKMVTVSAFLTVATSKNWELHQMDVHNAFLHGDLEEEVYMNFFSGFESSDPDLYI
ncbi:hypothetical protein AgCh_030659 [Apium graveolens]